MLEGVVSNIFALSGVDVIIWFDGAAVSISFMIVSSMVLQAPGAVPPWPASIITSFFEGLIELFVLTIALTLLETSFDCTCVVSFFSTTLVETTLAFPFFADDVGFDESDVFSETLNFCEGEFVIGVTFAVVSLNSDLTTPDKLC